MTDINSGYIYGLREIVLKSLDGGTVVSFPAAQVLTFTEAIVSDQLRGDDKVVATVGQIEMVEFNAEKGGISLEAYAFITGESVVTTGSTPNRQQSMVRKAGTNFPYRQIFGRALGDGTDDMYIHIKKGKFTSVEGNLGNQEFLMYKGSGQGIGDDNDEIFEIVKRETAGALP